jgi:hypothetical protein
MKISDNTHPISINKMPKFKCFCICNKGEIATFLRGTKTFGSPFMSVFLIIRTQNFAILVMSVSVTWGLFLQFRLFYCYKGR